MTLGGRDRYDPDRMDSLGESAVVAGGSLAGLCAAGVLADGFEEVVVLERDEFPDGAVAREGAPQTGHPHILLEAGRTTLEDLFPGFSERLASAGGLIVDAATDMTYYDQGGPLADGPERLPMYCASRPLIESVVRQQVAAIPNVILRGGHRFTGFETDADTNTVTGVSITAGDDESVRDAALVIDATGRTSQTPAWLAANGYRTPPEDEVHVDVTYSTVRVERPPGDRRVLGVPPSPPRTRGGAAVPVENDQWEVIMQGVHGDAAPTDRAGFVAFAESLPLDALGDVVAQRSWVSDEIRRYPFPSSLRRRYDALDRFPDGLIVTGDAVASFNPIYGQGMSVAALDALSLHHALAAGGVDGVAPRFFDRVADVVDDVWAVSVGADFAFLQTTGPKPRGTDLFNRYVDRLLRQAQTDGVLRNAFFRVFRLEAPPTSLLRPGIVWRVFRPDW
jgi:2-polyprenyl-6-methoxyphenol hydroxylase-like FAD-dependent oxidoreductase